MQKSQKTEPRKICALLSLSLLLTVMQLLGWQISMKYGTSVHTSRPAQALGILSNGQCLLAGILEFAVWSALLSVAFHFLDKRKPHEKTCSLPSRLWLFVVLLLFLCWLPTLLGCYPGFYNYDIAGQLPQVMYQEVTYNTHHPLLHTLVAGGLITLGYHLFGESLEMGVLLHSIIQMLLCAAFFTYFIQWIHKTTGKRWTTLCAFCYYAFSPVIVMFTMSTTKDVICSLCLQMSILLLYELSRDGTVFWSSRPRVLGLFVSMVFACLFRNNVLYAVILFLFIMLFRRKENRKTILLLLCVVVASFACNHGLKLLLKAEEGSMVEACSVPLQQVARVYVQEGLGAFTQEELKLIDAAATEELLLNYNPFSSDNIKNYIDFGVITDRKWEYLQLWLTKGMQYPAAYLMSFLENTYQAWYPGTSILCSPQEEATYYFHCENLAAVPIQSKIPQIYDFYWRISYESSYQKYPLIRLLFSIGAMLWAAFFTEFYGIWSGRKEIIHPQLLVLLICFTVFLGPVSLVRYYLVLFYGLPVSVAFLTDGKNRCGLL